MASKSKSGLTALAFNCSLKASNNKEKSSTDVLLGQLLDALAEHGVTGEIVRAVDHDIKPGMSSDEGDGDAWPALRGRVPAADILVIGSPIGLWPAPPRWEARRVRRVT